MEIMSDRLTHAEIAALCAEYGVRSLYELPAAEFDALCFGKAERVIEELVAERGEPLPWHGELVEQVPPGFKPTSECAAARSTLREWCDDGRLSYVRKKSVHGLPRLYYSAVDIERLTRISRRRYLMK